MEALATIFRPIGDYLVSPVFRLLAWLSPKIYWLHEGESALVAFFGCRTYILNPGVHVVPPFTDVWDSQVIGLYVDLPEQGLCTRDGSIFEINGSIIYAVVDLRKAILQTDWEQLETIAQSAAQDGIRNLAANTPSNQLMDSDKVSEQICGQVNRKLRNRHGIELTRVMIADLHPKDVQKLCDTLTHHPLVALIPRFPS